MTVLVDDRDAPAAVPETTANFDAGRFSGWWAIVAHAPAIAGHSSVLVLLAAPAGAAALASLLLGLRARERAILGIAFVAFSAALTANYYCWQRYHEPFLLCFVPACILLQANPADLRSGKAFLPPIALALVLGAVSFVGFRGEPWPIDTLPAPHHIAPTDRFSAQEAASEPEMGLQSR